MPTPAGRADVYDITVDEAHEFFANGILVSNSEALGYYVHEAHPMTTKGIVEY